MTRRISTMWVAAATAVTVTACGAAVEQPPEPAVDPPTAQPQAPDEEPEGSAPDGTDTDDPDGPDGPVQEDREPADGGSSATPEGDDGGTPWHLLPEADRPGPIEQPECEPATLAVVAC